MRKDAPVAVDVPPSSRDNPGWAKVGVIAAVGFVVGIAWPRIVGIRLGPAAPGESTAAASASRAPEPPPPSVTKAPAAVALAPTASAVPSSPATAVSAGGAPNITVQKGVVLSCKTADGDTRKGTKDCGAVPGIDLLVGPRVRKIATCAGVEGQTGKLALTVSVDFSSGRLAYDVGKASTLQNVEAVTACLKTSFQGTSTAATPHEHPRYTVAYTAIFAPGSPQATGDDKAPLHKTDLSDKSAKEAPEKDGKASDLPAANSGEGQVAWEVALVRDAPKTGSIVSRLPRGTKVKVGGSVKDGWYPIKFGDGFGSQGWVYRGAIGR